MVRTGCMARRVEHSIFPTYVLLAYAVWNWWLKSKLGHWLYFFMDYNRPFSHFVHLHV